LASSPTLTAHATELGVLLGTAAYMAPEQARGRPVAKRADIWAFGVILFDMLTGRRLFVGETTVEGVASVVSPPFLWERLPADPPANVRRLQARCLEPDPRPRLRDIGEARILLDAAADRATTNVEAGPAQRSWRGMATAAAL